MLLTLICCTLLTLGLSAQEEVAQVAPARERGSLFKVGRATNIAPDERAENIICIAGDVTVLGEVSESVIVVGGKVRISGEVRESVIAVGDDVILEAGAVIGQDVVSIGGEVRRDPAAVIGGEIRGEEYWSRIAEGWDEFGRFGARFLAGRSWFGFIVGLIASLVIGLILAHFLPRQIENQSKAIIRAPLQVIGWGVLAAIIFIPLSILIGITIIGIPLILLLVLSYIYAAFIGLLASGLLLGKNLAVVLRLGRPGMVGSLVIGIVVIALLRLIPILGEIITIVVAFLGFGAAIVTRFGISPLSARAGEPGP